MFQLQMSEVKGINSKTVSFGTRPNAESFELAKPASGVPAPGLLRAPTSA